MPAAFLSLRWKLLIAVSMLLVVTNASLAFLAYRQAVKQFELQQSDIRQWQGSELRARLKERLTELSKLGPLVPLMGPSPPLPDLREQLKHALETNSAMLHLEWDIRSVHWLGPDGSVELTWPPQTQSLPEGVLARIRAEPERPVEALSCDPSCRQLLAIPILWEGRFGGSLVLGSSLADSLLAFNQLTGADVAVSLSQSGGESAPAGTRDVGLYPAITHPERSTRILAEARKRLAAVGDDGGYLMVRYADSRYEIFRPEALAPDTQVYIINDVTAQQRAIGEAASYSMAIGVVGLLLSEGLLLLLLKTPLARLRSIAVALPLLAENRYEDLRSRLPRPRRQALDGLNDETDLMVKTVDDLTDRMEALQRDREQAEARLVWLADHDSLTALFNRRRFHDDFIRALDQALRFGHTGAVLFVDLDQFKDVNDISGHHVGDALLQRVAEHLQALARPSDILARLGGDEFAWVLPEATPEDAVRISERILELIRSIVLQTPSRRHQVSASVGIVLFPEQGTDAEQILANADLAMYQAKEKGRGRWNLFSHSDQAREQADARVLLCEQIAEALEHDRFQLHFQPIVEVKTGKVTRLEALLRMRDSQDRTVYPDRFIPVAEKTGQIKAIDHWVLDHALGLMRIYPRLRLSVNLSANAMDDPELLPDLTRLLERFEIRPGRLSFEITETAAVNSVSRATKLMQDIQDLGCRFALDDFGSGYASYAYLRQLPVDDIKVDGVFIRNLTRSREDRIFVRAITDMAHGMGKQVIAEYVENGEIFQVLAELGVDFAQGYHFGRPRPLGDGGTFGAQS